MQTAVQPQVEPEVEPSAPERKPNAPAEIDSLLLEHQRLVYRIAFSLLRNHHDAEDAAQEALLRVWRAAGRLSEVRDTTAWVARIAWNAATDRLRRRREITGVDPEAIAAVIAQRRGRGESVEDLAAASEMRQLLEPLIASLPGKLRDAIVLSTVEELSIEEIAGVLEINPAAVRMRLFLARRLLRSKLEKLLKKQSRERK